MKRDSLYFLGHNKFFVLFCVHLFSSIGEWLTTVGAMVLIYDQMHVATGLSFLLLVRALPTLLFSPIAGVIADRFDRRKILFYTEILRGICLLPLIFTQQTWTVYCVVCLVSSIGVFSYPAITALVPNVTKRQWVVRANAWLSTGEMAALFIGPSCASLILEWCPISYIFLVDALSFILFGLVVTSISSTQEKGLPRSVPWWKEFLQAFSFFTSSASGTRVLLGDTICWLTMGILGTLELPFCTQILQISSNMYGYLLALSGLGAILFLPISERIPSKSSLILYFFGMIFFQVGIIAYSYQSTFYGAVFILLLLGATESAFTVGSRSYLQLTASDSVLGKIMSQKNVLERVGFIVGIGCGGMVPMFISSADLSLRFLGAFSLGCGSLFLLLHIKESVCRS